MTATWYLMKHVPDLRRREPRNVGVILQAPDGSWRTKFLGEGADGRIDGRQLRGESMNLDAYRSWVDYFRRKASNAGWTDVDRLQKHRVGSYFAEIGGASTVEDAEDPSALIERLFAELVRTPESESEKIVSETVASYLRARVDKVLELVNVPIIRNTHVPAIFEGHYTTVPFGYEYTNGQKHLMDLVHRRGRLEDAAADARELRARLQGARAAGAAESFFSFYSSKLIKEDQVDAILYPVEELSIALDVENRKDTVEQLRAKMLH